MPNAQTHDALHRRHRQRPVSTGKSVTLQPRDLIWLQKLHEHGPLSSSFLHAFSRRVCRNDKRARDRLTDLFNEDRTPHGGPYLLRPWQQFATFDSRYQELVYDLAPAAERALKQKGLWRDSAGGASGPWKHRYMVAAITASIELATLDRKDVSFIPQHAILDRADAVLRCPVPFDNPATGKRETRDLIPDALFGLEYRNGDKRSFRFFVVEADRGTEPTRSGRFDRKSHLRTFLQYREYVGRGLYKQHLGLTAGMLVLNVTAHERNRTAMMAALEQISSRGNSYQLFAAIDGFGVGFRPLSEPIPMDKLTWAKIGDDGMNILDA